MLEWSELLVLLLTLPLAASLVLNGWELTWNGQVSGPLPIWGHRLLMTIQFLTLAWLASGQLVEFAVITLATLYATMAAGVTWMVQRQTRTSCGCWGQRSGRLTLKLAMANTICALLALLALLGAPNWSPASGLGFALMAFVASFLILIAIPEWRYVYRGACIRAEPFRLWVKGHPELAD